MLSWTEVKPPKGTARLTQDGSYSIANPAPSEGGKWDLHCEVGQRKYLGDFDTLAEAKAAAESHAKTSV